VIEDHEEKLASEPEHLKFLSCPINNDQFEEIVSYNDLMNLLESEEERWWGEQHVGVLAYHCPEPRPTQEA
jgi:hypothetical protein